MTGHRCQRRNTKEKEEVVLVSRGTEESEKPTNLIKTKNAPAEFCEWRSISEEVNVDE